jgi:hypothetical protein
MRVREAKDFLVEQTVRQAEMEGIALSELERRVMYFTESGECPEDPIELNNAFEAQCDSTAYEKKVSRLMAHAYRRIQQNDLEKLHLWNEAFRILGKGDHYILVFWSQSPSGKSPRIWPTYVFGALAAAGLFALILFLFGSKDRTRRGEPAPADKYLPEFSPLIQHTLQTLFLIALVLAIFPGLLYKLRNLIQRLVRPTSPKQLQK